MTPAGLSSTQIMGARFDSGVINWDDFPDGQDA
jgi:hypothetical protein